MKSVERISFSEVVNLLANNDGLVSFTLFDRSVLKLIWDSLEKADSDEIYISDEKVRKYLNISTNDKKSYKIIHKDVDNALLKIVSVNKSKPSFNGEKEFISCKNLFEELGLSNTDFELYVKKNSFWIIN